MNDIQAFATYPLTPEGSEFSYSDIASGIDSHKKSLIALIPRLRSLQHSTLDHRLQHAQSGLHVKFVLEKSPQQPLPLLNKQPNGKVISPSFESEVQEIVQALSGLGERLLEAASPVANPVDNRHTQTLRKLLKKRVGGDESAFPLEVCVPNAALDGVATQQALGTTAIAVVEVKVLTRTSAEVVVTSFLNRAPNNLLPARRMKFSMKRTKKHQTVESGHRLQEAMDKKIAITLDVIVTGNWITGDDHSLELLNFR